MRWGRGRAAVGRNAGASKHPFLVAYEPHYTNPALRLGPPRVVPAPTRSALDRTNVGARTHLRGSCPSPLCDGGCPAKRGDGELKRQMGEGLQQEAEGREGTMPSPPSICLLILIPGHVPQAHAYGPVLARARCPPMRPSSPSPTAAAASILGLHRSPWARLAVDIAT